MKDCADVMVAQPGQCRSTELRRLTLNSFAPEYISARQIQVFTRPIAFVLNKSKANKKVNTCYEYLKKRLIHKQFKERKNCK